MNEKQRQPSEEPMTVEQLQAQDFAYKICLFIGFEDARSPEFEQDYQEVLQMVVNWLRGVAHDDPEILKRAGVK